VRPRLRTDGFTASRWTSQSPQARYLHPTRTALVLPDELGILVKATRDGDPLEVNGFRVCSENFQKPNPDHTQEVRGSSPLAPTIHCSPTLGIVANDRIKNQESRAGIPSSNLLFPSPQEPLKEGLLNNLFYDVRDREAARVGDRRLKWLYELGAKPLSDAKPTDDGFVFAGARGIEDYRTLLAPFPRMRDRPEERAKLLDLNKVLDALEDAKVRVPTPRTWRLSLDSRIPADLKYPLFVRTGRSSWKLGGQISKVRNEPELIAEMEALRRAIQWDAIILAREWVDLAPAGAGAYGNIPQEVRVWIVDGKPFAWSFHYLQVVADPSGFPPSEDDLDKLRELAGGIGKAFKSRCVMADFAKLKKGGWIFIEAGPGSAAGTAHEGVFRSVAQKLSELRAQFRGDAVGGLFAEN
jgi:hypothetical protein